MKPTPVNTDITIKNYEKVGQTLAALRTGKEISQGTFGSSIGKPQSFISTTESGGRLPALKTLVLILDKLGYKLTIQKK